MIHLMAAGLVAGMATRIVIAVMRPDWRSDDAWLTASAGAFIVQFALLMKEIYS